MAEIDTSKTVSELEIDGVNVQLAGDGGSTELPAYMSAKYFTFSGNACTGYTGDNTLPEIIIPKSYSIDSDGNFIDGDDYQVTAVGHPTTTTTFRQFQNNIVLLNNITRIDNSAFSICKSLTNVVIPDSVTSINFSAFSNCKSLTNVVIPSSVTSIGISAFQYCTNLTTITILDGVTSIDSYAFHYCSSLTNIEIPDSVTSIGNSAFQSCSSLTNIEIPNSVTSIDSSAFAGCTGLTNVTIPDSVTSISSSTFTNCIHLLNIIIPNSVTRIGRSAFSGCRNLTTMTVLATTPPTLVDINAISTATTSIYVPDESVSAYQSATNWSNFADKIQPLSSKEGDEYAKIICADLPDRTIELSNSSGTISTKTTPATTGGVVTFDVENTGEYTVTVSDTTGTLWSNTVTVNEIGIYNVKVPDIYAEGESMSITERYAMNRYTPTQLHTILQNGYFSKMFDVKSKWNYVDSSSILNNYDFFVEKIEKTESGAEIAYMRLCYAISSYNINPYFAYMTSETATSFSTSYSSAGGYKYSVMRQRMMLQGETVYSQATGLKPSGNTTIADGTGIEFDKLYYTNGNGTTSGVYTYNPETDTFTQDTEMEYFSSSTTARTDVKFVKGYFVSVGTLTEEEFNAGYYYTYNSSKYTYTQATTYSSSTTYYGFYETLQENGVFYDALSSISQYLVKTDNLASTGLTNTTYTSQTEDYVDLPCVEEITGINRNTILWGNMNSSTTTSGTNIGLYNIVGEGTKRPAYDDFQVQAIGPGYWTRSAYPSDDYSFCRVHTFGYISNSGVYATFGVRLGFKLG